jgi:hypothetical protein
MESRSVEGHDAGRLLTAMLKSMKAERRDGGCVRVSEYAEHTAFFAQPVGLEVEIVGLAQSHAAPVNA